MAATVKRAPIPKCRVCPKLATKFCEIRISDGEGHEHQIGEVDLCDQHWQTWRPKDL
jgi:hypothetical protein